MKSIEGNFEEEKVNELLLKHFKELRSVSPANSCHVLDINGLKKDNIKFWSLWEKVFFMGFMFVPSISYICLCFYFCWGC